MVLNANSKKDLEDFKSYILVEKNFSKHTAKAYYADILAFLIWLGDSQCEEVSFSKVREYLKEEFGYDGENEEVAAGSAQTLETAEAAENAQILETAETTEDDPS